MTTYTGTPSTLVAGDTSALVTKFNDHRDALKALTDAWTSYTPTWTAISSNPSIENGTITGGYAQLGHLVIYRFRIAMGSTTTYGSGGFVITLPVAAAAAYPQNAYLFSGSAQDTSAGTAYPLSLQRLSTSTTAYFGSPSGTLVSGLVPFTFADGDTLSGAGVYEAA